MTQLPTDMNKDAKVRIRSAKSGPFFQTNDQIASKKQQEAVYERWKKIIDAVDTNKDLSIDFNEMLTEVKKYLKDYPKMIDDYNI